MNMRIAIADEIDKASGRRKHLFTASAADVEIIPYDRLSRKYLSKRNGQIFLRKLFNGEHLSLQAMGNHSLSLKIANPKFDEKWDELSSLKIGEALTFRISLPFKNGRDQKILEFNLCVVSKIGGEVIEAKVFANADGIIGSASCEGQD
jgi:hypothetical protein